MHTAVKLVLVGAIAVLASACSHSPIPVSENFPLTVQKKVQSAGHWDLVSRDSVAQMTTRLAAIGITPGELLSVSSPAHPTAFELALNEFLITELVKAGYPVSVDPAASATRVSFRTQIIPHDSARHHLIPGRWTALTAGLYVLHDLATHASPAGAMAGGLGFAALADLAEEHYSGGPTGYELILTTTVERQGRYAVRQSDVYYIERADTSLFMSSAVTQSKPMKVVGP